MKKGFCFLISCLFFHSVIFANVNLLNDYLELYYSGEDVDIEEVKGLYEEAMVNLEANPTETSIVYYLKSSMLLSTLYSSGKFPEYHLLVESLKETINQKIQIEKLTENGLLAYADYLYSEFSWNNNNSEIIIILPNIYRKILTLNKNNKEALLKLALWYISASSYYTSNWNAFILGQEKNIESLFITDKFNAYILYSMFYMKNYDVDKGLENLIKAKGIFPNNPMIFVVESNYNSGKIGW